MPLKHYSSNSFLPSASLPTGTLNVGKHVKTSYRNLFSKSGKTEKVSESKHLPAIFWSQAYAIIVSTLRKQQLELAWKQWKISKGDEPSGDIYSIVELRTMLAEALDKLPENTRLIFEKNRFEGKKYTEIAEEQQISVKTVEAHISKALKILRVELKDYLPFLILLFQTPDKYI